MDLRRAYLEMRKTGEASFPPACLDYVYRLVYRLAAPEGQARHADAASLCGAFRQAARGDFGDLAPAVMENWGIASGADLGRAIFQLARFRCLALREGETLEEYAAAGSLHFT